MTDPTPAEALKVCPFCRSTRLADSYGRRASAYCIECGASGPEAETAEEARALFILRPPAADAGEVRENVVDACREICAQVVERHVDLALCRKLAPEAPGTFYKAARHIADDIRAATITDHPRFAQVPAAAPSPTFADGIEAAANAIRDRATFWRSRHGRCSASLEAECIDLAAVIRKLGS